MRQLERLAAFARWTTAPLAAVAIGFFVLVDLLTADADPQRAVLTAGVGALAGVCTVQAIARRDYLPAATLVGAGSLLLTWVEQRSTTLDVWLGFAESLSLYLLVVGSVRRATVWQAYAPVLAAVAAIAIPWRIGDPVELVLVLVAVAGVTAATSLGLYLRYQDHQRRTGLDAARQSERLELSRELHDVVGHHLTGIVVRAQAARFTGAPDDATAEALRAIEDAGAQALDAIRSMVGPLQDDATRPAPSLADVTRVVDDLRATHPVTSFAVDDSLAARWLPPEVATSVLRIVQESATNVRKHGLTDEPVWITLDVRDATVVLDVRNQAARRASTPAGYGLAGMAARVESLGGRFWAGDDGQGGWRLSAALPLAPTRLPRVAP
jgi:signal transduction histidine kinase